MLLVNMAATKVPRSGEQATSGGGVLENVRQETRSNALWVSPRVRRRNA
jgi:hypothetical protein